MFPALSASELRRKVGMVFQQPNPLPMSIAKNMIFPLKLRGRVDRQTAEFLMEANLKRVGLWDEVKDRLSDDARRLSGGQQQRLCLARALMLEPEILLLDEPTSSLDEPAAHAIEDLLLALKEQCTIVLVSHYLAQVHRIAGRVFRLENHQFREITRY